MSDELTSSASDNELNPDSLMSQLLSNPFTEMTKANVSNLTERFNTVRVELTFNASDSEASPDKPMWLEKLKVWIKQEN